MSPLSRFTATTTLAALLSVGAFAAEKHAAGPIDLGNLPSAEGAEYVEVNIRNNLIAMAARLAEKEEPDVANMLRAIQQVRVNVVGLADANRSEVQKRIKAIRAQLDGAGWERIVVAQKDKSDVAVFAKTRGDEAVEGVVVTVLDDNKQAVLVNVVGDIRPEKLAQLGERFDVEPLKKLGLEAKPRP
jgi:hypothetical protein